MKVSIFDFFIAVSKVNYGKSKQKVNYSTGTLSNLQGISMNSFNNKLSRGQQ